ncbi:YjbQ family protein [bacterium]|nr:YjbQ family protein [bacterium]
MRILTDFIELSSRGKSDIVDLTERVQECVGKSGLSEGQVLVFAPGATAGITTLEYEPGLKKDIPEALDRIAPADADYHHNDTWHDGNGHSHVRASLLGPSLAVPFKDGRLLLGTWQQIVLIDCDNRPRSRRIVVQLTGE